jgi:hypothetical protein
VVFGADGVTEVIPLKTQNNRYVDPDNWQTY